MNSRTNKPNPKNNSYDASNNPQRYGLPCGVCGEPISIYGFKLCNRCHIVLCVKHRRSRIEQSDLPPQFRRRERLHFVEFCPDCFDEVEREAQEKIEEEDLKEKEYQEWRENQVVHQCSICSANDAPDEGPKTFPSGLQLSFHTCGRCGKLVCNSCILSATDMMHGYFYEAIVKYEMVCKECYEALESEYATRWEEEFGETSEGPNPYRDEQKR